MARLELEQRQHLSVALVIHFALQRHPARNVLTRRASALVVRVVDALHQCFAAVQFVVVRHVVEEQQKVIRRGCGSGILCCKFRRVLLRVACAGRAALHADAVLFSLEPLAPSVALCRLDARAEVVAKDVGQRTNAVGPGIVFVD